MLFKVCSRCHHELPANEFYAHPSARYGVQDKCKACHKRLMRERAAQIPTEQRTATHRAWRERRAQREAGVTDLVVGLAVHP